MTLDLPKINTGQFEPSIVRTESARLPPLFVSAHVAVVVRLESLPSSSSIHPSSIRRPSSMRTQFVRHFSSSSFMNQFCGWASRERARDKRMTRSLVHEANMPEYPSIFVLNLTLRFSTYDGGLIRADKLNIQKRMNALK